MNEKLLNALDQISDEHILEAANRKKSRRPYWLSPVAAILALAVLIGVAYNPLRKLASTSINQPDSSNIITTPVDPDNAIDESQWELRERSVLLYDADGNMIEETRYDENGILSHVVNSYINNLLVESTCRYTNDEEHYTIYSYDDQGHLVAEVSYENGVETCCREFQYDENGNQINCRVYTDGNFESPSEEHIAIYDSNNLNIEYIIMRYGEESVRISNTYNENGLLVQESTLCADGYSETYHYQYDEDGRLTEEIYLQNGEEILKKSYTYHETPIQSEVRCQASDGTTTQELKRFDKHDNLIEEIFHFNDQPTERNVYRYDQEGRMIEALHYVPVGSQSEEDIPIITVMPPQGTDLTGYLLGVIEESNLSQYALEIQGLCTPITLWMDGLDLVGVQIYDFTLDAPMYSFQNCPSFTLQQYEDMFILQHMEDTCHEGWLIGPDLIYPFSRADGFSTELCVNEDVLGYTLYLEEYAYWQNQYDTFAIFEIVHSRDAVVLETGTVILRDGVVGHAVRECYTISDLYDLDALFARAKERGLYEEYETVDQLFASYPAVPDPDPEPEPDPEPSEEQPLVMAQKLTNITISNYDDYSVIYDYQYDGNDLISMVYTQTGMFTVETTYDGSYYRPLVSTCYNLYADSYQTEFTYTYTYDDSGKLVTARKEYSQIRDEEYFYNDQGQKIRCDVYLNDEKYCVVTYQYDAAGNMVQEDRNYLSPQSYLNSNNNTTVYFSHCRDTYVYDDEGRIIEEILSDDGGVYNHFTYEYDEYGRKINLYEVTDYVYDENGLLQSLMYYGEPVTFEYETVYVTPEQAREMQDMLNDVLGEWLQGWFY